MMSSHDEAVPKNGSLHCRRTCGSFQKSGALTWTPSSRALVIRTPTKRTPIDENSHVRAQELWLLELRASGLLLKPGEGL